MCKKPDARLLVRIKEHKKEINEQIQVTVPHLNGLTAKFLKDLASSDKIHKKLEELL